MRSSYTVLKSIDIQTILLSFLLFTACKKSESVPAERLSFQPGCTDSLSLFAEDIVSTRLYERDITIHPQGSPVIYTISNNKQNIRALIQLHHTDGVLSSTGVLPFSGKYQDLEAAFNAKGNEMYFVSDRPMPGENSRGDFNIWQVDYDGTNWSDPHPLDTLINTQYDEFYPSMTHSGNLYFTAHYPGGSEDIYRSRFIDGKFEKPEALDSSINSNTYEFNAFVTPDENYIFFSSFGRPDGMGGGDLYGSKKTDGGRWAKAKNLGTKVNSTALDFCPSVDFSQECFYFTSTRRDNLPSQIIGIEDILSDDAQILNGAGNIYKVSWKMVSDMME